MLTSKLAAPFAFALVMLSGRPSFADCTKDSECKDTRICVEGGCVERSVPTPQAASSRPRFERRSKGMFVGGIVALSFVPVALTVAAFGAMEKQSCENDADYDRFTSNPAAYGANPGTTGNCGGYKATIVGGIVASVVLLGGGLGMLLYGVKKVPVEPAIARVRPWLSETSAGLGWQTSF